MSELLKLLPESGQYGALVMVVVVLWIEVNRLRKTVHHLANVIHEHGMALHIAGLVDPPREDR